MKQAVVGPCRNLHFVFKIADRKSTTTFLRNLGMKDLRHEEFTEGCAAACNGPYSGHWSKTMVGYADEDSSFALELTYNYSVKKYDIGNDFNSITICKTDAFKAAKNMGGQLEGEKTCKVISPDGYKFVVTNMDVSGPNPITEIALNVEDLDRSLLYWNGFLGLPIEASTEEHALLRCGVGQTALKLVHLPLGTKIYHGTGYGRIAFSCPGHQLQQLEADVMAAGYTVHTPYVSLDTPGKATVQVVILQDPDGHEICFVGDEGFKDLSKMDPLAASLLDEGILKDKSDEWEAKRLQREAVMSAKGV
ncbi:hypothetical protein CEUSTIGMA_g3564.t1 [Chlamydomonas eustigma]|uniref:VOC domain-containing protein n=1 Tax=Chlamydomonas eustigma TaxID=1157962 RepID=A0A250WZ65_9CHLO|nr:hypothetical protein CEUSTIGMA_g3564.t1 [Chlamydomonas eustigma]|eukprot:GAX76121.1 hypothetical protein CEUSTIGMA_g3564.t1 [Chlamydomonas eustigma]